MDEQRGDRGTSICDTIVDIVKGYALFCARDAFYLARKRGANLRFRQVAWSLRYLCDTRRAMRIFYHRSRNVYSITKSASEAKIIIAKMERSILDAVQKAEFTFSGGLTGLGSSLAVARSATFLILSRMWEQGLVLRAPAISYRGRSFNFYFAPEKKGLLEKRLSQLLDYLENNKTALPSKAAQDLGLDHDAVGCLLGHLSYLGQVNQIISLPGRPFSLPGYSTYVSRTLDSIGKSGHSHA